MNPILRNVLVVIGGILIGGFINSSIIQLTGDMVPLPEGVDPNDIESIKANIHRYTPMNFLMPFLAHAIGTLTGAYFVARLAASTHLSMALIIGGIFLLGGITMVFMVGGPIWFIILDLVVAYIPMAWLGHKLARPNG